MKTGAIREDIKNLKYMIEHSSSKSLKNFYTIILLNLSDLLHELTDEAEEIKITARNTIFMLKYNYNINNQIIEQITRDEYKKMINELTKNAKRFLKLNDKTYYFDSYLSLKDAKDLLLSFVCQYDISLYPIVKKIIDEEHLFLIKDKTKNGDGYSFFNPYSNSSYTILYNDNDENKLSFENLICLAHEIGHVIHFNKILTNPRNYAKVISSNFIEVPSTTFETLFIDYLLSNKIHIDETNMVLKNNLSLLKSYLYNLRITNLGIDLVTKSQEIIYEELEEFLLSKGIILDEDEIYSIFSKIPHNYSYSYGGIIAFYYLESFKNDPEKTKKSFNDFVNCIGIFDDFYMLSNFGIDKDKLIKCSFLKDIIQENQKQLKF